MLKLFRLIFNIKRKRWTHCLEGVERQTLTFCVSSKPAVGWKIRPINWESIYFLLWQTYKNEVCVLGGGECRDGKLGTSPYKRSWYLIKTSSIHCNNDLQPNKAEDVWVILSASEWDSWSSQQFFKTSSQNWSSASIHKNKIQKETCGPQPQSLLVTPGREKKGHRVNLNFLHKHINFTALSQIQHRPY